jgi:hypothetical protein
MHLTNPIEAYIERAAKFVDHPAILGIDVGDEPSMLDFPHYGKVIEAMKAEFPNKLLYLNLYPSYGMLASAGTQQAQRELGTDTYTEYLTAYTENVDLPYLSIDHYPYSSNLSTFLLDLKNASDVTKMHGKELMTVLQVNSHVPDVFISTEQLRFQAWCALAYGSRSVAWACYSPGWWHNCVLDKNGAKTEQYEKLKTVNAELRRLADKYMTYTHVKTEICKSGKSHIDELGVKIDAECELLTGQFLDKNGSPALLCVPLDSGKRLSVSQSDSPKKRIYIHKPDETVALDEQNDSVCHLGEPFFIYNE